MCYPAHVGNHRLHIAYTYVSLSYLRTQMSKITFRFSEIYKLFLETRVLLTTLRHIMLCSYWNFDIWAVKSYLNSFIFQMPNELGSLLDYSAPHQRSLHCPNLIATLHFLTTRNPGFILSSSKRTYRSLWDSAKPWNACRWQLWFIFSK